MRGERCAVREFRLDCREVKQQILVVEDDPDIADLLRHYLERADYDVHTVGHGAHALPRMHAHRPDLVILDRMLPGMDGLEICRHVRNDDRLADLPVIMVTARADEMDRIVGLELGADDYITKPFGLRELLARIRAVLRRAEAGGRRARGKARRGRYRFADWELDMRTRRLTAPNGETIPLTAGEFNLLTAFLRSPQHVLSRDQLLEASRVHDQEVFDRSVDVQILRLRRKLEADPSNPRLIRTERGAGYIFAAPVETL